MGVRRETTHSTNDPSKTGMLTNRRMKLDLYLSSCTKKKSKIYQRPYLKSETLKLLEKKKQRLTFKTLGKARAF